MVSGRNLLTCAFLTSGHILGLSTRLSPSSHILTFSHLIHWVSIRPAQLTYLIITQLSSFSPYISPSSEIYHKHHITIYIFIQLHLTSYYNNHSSIEQPIDHNSFIVYSIKTHFHFVIYTIIVFTMPHIYIIIY